LVVTPVTYSLLDDLRNMAWARWRNHVGPAVQVSDQRAALEAARQGR
jgi:hypothetical protein